MSASGTISGRRSRISRTVAARTAGRDSRGGAPAKGIPGRPKQDPQGGRSPGGRSQGAVPVAGPVAGRSRSAHRVRAPRHRILLASIAVLGLGLLGVLLLSTVISQGAFRQHDLEVKLILLAEREEALSRELRQAEAPLELEKKARKLGMVPAAAPIFLRLSDGAILGVAVPAPPQVGKVDYRGAPGPLPSRKPKPKASPSAGTSDAAAVPAQPPVDSAAAGQPAQGAVAPPASQGATEPMPPMTPQPVATVPPSVPAQPAAQAATPEASVGAQSVPAPALSSAAPPPTGQANATPPGQGAGQ